MGCGLRHAPTVRKRAPAACPGSPAHPVLAPAPAWSWRAGMTGVYQARAGGFRISEAPVLGWLRRRRLSAAGEQRLLIALARADEELLETHVRNALGVLDAVADELPLNRALALYLDAVEPPEPQASMIARRVMARLESGERPASRSARRDRRR